ncbi:SufE family protein [Blattabacterium punctulatus]|uniref:SufE family protein n=1 Tax=Blattabacterium punctulatus TaxID=164514 RepID=A0ABN5M1X4_9FLAO|nr:SufE family protein [Blattabacterium punctulatus]AWU39689.1 SufE family protein [Blattabacterium punctulatus]AWU40234.1 SufE family protein [Blattabacterium punctulatus]AWU42489.1 SufE family protein [Blattabacterium punctulatus]AWU43031.1 SufE family protein [Blattabacterium punctulatus]AWU45768.1 SufE family protein [Blattabacterium punctulatus]
MTLQNKEEKIKKEFLLLKNWEEKYEYIIDLGKNLPKKSNIFRSEDKLIHGCQSNIWLEAKLKGVRIFFDADSDALLPRGMAAIMIRIYSGHFPFEIISYKANFISEIGFRTFLSPIRANGILLFLKKIKFYAIAFNEKISVSLNGNNT